MLVLPERMKVLAELAKEYKTIADIGTDHGLIPNYLVSHNPSIKVIATDISEKCLAKSIKTSKLYGTEGQISHRVGDGLEPLEGEQLDCIIIAGMGGLLISDIIRRDLNVVKETGLLLLQPMNASELLRNNLRDLNFDIVGEELAKEEHRVYEILIVNPHQKWMTNLYIDGKISDKLLKPRHRHLNDFVQWRLRELHSIKDELINANSLKAKNKLYEIELEIEKWEAIRRES